MDSGRIKTDRAFDAVIEHWSRTRIDSALAAIGRYDDAAKQLIALGGAIQGLYFAAFAFGGLEDQLGNGWALPLLMFLFVPVLSVIFCAAQCICRFHLSAEAIGTYHLLLSGREDGLSIENLSKEMSEWCKSIDCIAEQKGRWLHRANRSFFYASLAVLIALVFVTVSAFLVPSK